MSEIHSVDVQTLKQWLQVGDILLVDVREDDEYEEGHIEQGVNVPLASVSRKVPALNGASDKKLVLYCRSGRRSMAAADMLSESGFRDIYNLEGGILAWQAAGFEVIASE